MHDVSENRKPRISVLTTVYNRQDFIAESIESVLAQTEGDFELILVDDCSTDSSMEVIKRYSTDKRVRVYRNERNLGDYGNRNYAASLARGEFMKYHDSDDIMYPHCLELMLSSLSAEPKAAFAFTASRAWTGGPAPMLLTPELAFEREFLGIGLFNGGPANALFRTDVFREMQGFEDIGAGSDHLFWMRACSRHSVLLTYTDLFFYRVHQGQEISSVAARRSYAKLHGLVWQFLQSPAVPISGAMLTRAKMNWLWIIAKLTLRSVRAGEFDEARTRLKQANISVGDWLKYLRVPQRRSDGGTPQEYGNRGEVFSE